MKLRRRYLLPLLLLPPMALWVAMEPSNHRDWTADNARLPYAEVEGERVRVHNVRNATYFGADSFQVAWETREYDLGRLRSAWFMVEPFSRDWQGPAHTLVSFGFGGDEFLAVSVEIRKEKGETYSALRGLLNQYELMYVFADERDVLGLRTNIRRHEVFLYPIRATPEALRAVFLDVVARANRLRERPEFYNTLTSTCTSNLVRHVNRVAPRRVPPSWKTLLPGYADQLAYRVGLIDTDLPFEAARERFHITGRAQRYADHPDFSLRIRQIETEVLP